MVYEAACKEVEPVKILVKEKERGGDGGRKRNLLRVYNARGAKATARRAGGWRRRVHESLNKAKNT